MPDPLIKLDAFYSVLINDPGALAPDDPRYVHHLHGSNAEDIISTLARACRVKVGSGVFYFTGQRGTGKSTELKRLSVEISDGRTKAFVVDALDFLSEDHLIEVEDLLLMVAVSFAEKVFNETGENAIASSGVFTRFAQFLQSEVALKDVKIYGITAEFKKAQKTISQRIRDYQIDRRESFANQCRSFVTELAEFVKQRLRCDKVVLVVDSLERLRGDGPRANEMFDHVVRVLGGDTGKLSFPEVIVIYSVPPFLAYLDNIQQYVRVFSLASVRVFEPPSKGRRLPRAGGLDCMRTVVTKRFADWSDLITQEALDFLLLESGGDLRLLLRTLLAETIDGAYYATDRLPLDRDDEIIRTVIQRQRELTAQVVVRAEYPLLASIGVENKPTLQDRAQLATLAHLFDVRAILNYRNGVDWVDVNPLLWSLIDNLPPPASGVAAA